MENKTALAKKEAFKKFMRRGEVTVVMVLIVLCVVTGAINPDFYRPSSFVNWFRAIAMALVPCIGLTFALGAGEIDLSVGSVLAFAGVVAGMCMKVFELPVWVSIVAALAASALGGALMGFCVIAFAIPPMIVTMGFQNIFRGFVNVLTAGSPYSQFPQSFNDLSQKTVGSWGGGLPICIFIALVLWAIAYFVMKYTVFGRNSIAIGGNRETARLAGIAVNKQIIYVHMLASVCAGIGGILTAARMGSAQVAVGTGQEMNAIASCVIGGTSIGGGTPTLIGTLLGVALMELLTIALTIVRVDVYWQKVVLGVIIIAAVASDTVKKARAAAGKG